MAVEINPQKVILNIERDPNLTEAIKSVVPENALPIKQIYENLNVVSLLEQQLPAAVVSNANKFATLLQFTQQGYPTRQTAVYSVEDLGAIRTVCEKEGIHFFSLPTDLTKLGEFLGQMSNPISEK